jgi:hypothetical protein
MQNKDIFLLVVDHEAKVEQLGEHGRSVHFLWQCPMTTKGKQIPFLIVNV